MPRVETVLSRRPDPAQIEAAALALREGKLVVLPTETVYGLAARADDPRVTERVRATKARPPSKPLARLAASKEDVEAATGKLPRTARVLAERFWPGPLTLVLEPESGGEALGFRVPGLVFTREVVARAGVPIVGTSANVSGGDEPTTATAALEALGDRVDVIYDGGPALLGRPSTVVRVPRGAPGPAGSRALEVLREGFLSRDVLVRALARAVLFVCTGNTCRSPMAEGIMRATLASRLGVSPGSLEEHGWSVRSAGTSAMGGGGAAEAAVSVMRERGI
ncbi:Sua5/YciO/YrdC/YwlC family protein, partial [bacterium]|nr:Sua5/YciO/YrdC/YwlC family protein [bacterium]